MSDAEAETAMRRVPRSGAARRAGAAVALLATGALLIRYRLVEALLRMPTAAAPAGAGATE